MAYKAEVNGLCIRSIETYKGGNADVSIFRDEIDWHRDMLRKKENEISIEDTYPLSYDYA